MRLKFCADIEVKQLFHISSKLTCFIVSYFQFSSFSQLSTMRMRLQYCADIEVRQLFHIPPIFRCFIVSCFHDAHKSRGVHNCFHFKLFSFYFIFTQIKKEQYFSHFRLPDPVRAFPLLPRILYFQAPSNLALLTLPIPPLAPRSSHVRGSFFLVVWRFFGWGWLLFIDRFGTHPKKSTSM